MSDSIEVNEITRQLNLLIESDTGTPAMIVVAPDQGDGLIGNRGGFLRLALAAVKASEGEVQSFKDASWVYQNDLDWMINGLKPDADAHSYMPAPLSKMKRFRQAALGWAIVIPFVICLAVGFGTVVRWFMSLRLH